MNSMLPQLRQNSLLPRWLLLTLVCFFATTLLGCPKQLASMSLNGAIKRKDEAVANDAQQFEPTLLEETNSKINAAQSQLNTGQFKEAKVTAKEAKELSKTLLINTKTKRADFLKNEAFRWIKIADINQGQSEKPDLYEQIQLGNADGNKALEKQDFDKAILTFDKVVKDVQFLLSNLENEAKRGLEEAKSMKEDLLAEGAPEHAPEYIQTIDERIAQITRFIDEDKDYRNAIIMRDTARQEKTEGIQKTKEVKSRKAIVVIENLMNQADELGAAIFAQQSYSEIVNEIDNLVTQFYDKNYDTVLTLAPQLEPRVEDLIVETKRESARAQMGEVNQAITNLVDEKARIYLPGRVDQLEALRDEAQSLFEGQEYTESKNVSLRALDLNKKIIDEFDAMASQEVNKAAESLAAGSNVFNRMEEIFNQPIPGNWSGDDLALENSKKALQEELRAKLRSAELSLGVAELKREEKNFDLSIETSREVARSSAEVTRQTYRVVAHNAILEITNEMTRYERDGGRQYAAVELNKTGALLAESREFLRNGEYRNAVTRAAETKAQLEIMVQELERVAVDRLGKAQSAIEQARANRAEQYQNDTLTQALVAADRAADSLEKEGLKAAIESAINAENIASVALSNALRDWSETQMAESQRLINRARDAGAASYAAQQLQAAVELRNNLVRLHELGEYAQAVDIGMRAVEAADTALYAPVTSAENAIATAKRFKGWEFEPDRLAQAIVAAREAREKLDSGDFSYALQQASLAESIANDVTLSAKHTSFETRMASMRKMLAEARTSGTGYYQINDLAKILHEMNQLQTEFDPNSFEDYSDKVSLLEAQLAGMVENTPQVLTELVLAMNDRIGKLTARGADTFQPLKVDQAEMKIKFAQMDYKEGKYRSSFLNARDAQKLLDEIQLNLDERDFDATMNKYLVRFNEELKSFSEVLQMGSPSMTNMIIGPTGRSQAIAILGATSPSDLRTRIGTLGAQVRDLTPPPTRVRIHQSAIELFVTAKTSASNFEKMLILDQYSPAEAKQIIIVAYQQMFDARRQQQQIQSALEYPQTEVSPAGVQRVVSFQGY